MDPKQTAPQGGQEGQSAGPAGNAGFNFSADGSKASGKLSTGANVSRTMDSLNSEQGATYGGMSFSKHNFDKIEPGTGDIILNASDSSKPKRGLFGLGRKSSAKPSGWDMNAAQAEEAAKTGSAPTEQAFTTNRSSVAIVPSEYQNPAPVKKPINKKLLIGLAAIVLVVGVGAVVATVVVPNLSKGNKSNGGGSSYKESNLTLQESFNRYANWIFYGNDSTDELPADLIASTDSGLRGAMDGENSAAQNFLKLMNEYMQDFNTKFMKSNYATYDMLSNYIDEASTYARLLDSYYQLGDISVNSLLNDYSLSDENITTNDYSSLTDINYAGEQISEILSSRDKVIMELSRYIKDSGCVENNEINQDCQKKAILNSEEEFKKFDQINTQASDVEKLISMSASAIFNDSRAIRGELESPTANEEEEVE